MRQRNVRSCAPLITLFVPAILNAASLEPPTSKAWEEYIVSATATGRMEQRLAPGTTFLWMDEAPEHLARVRAGEIVVSQAAPQNPQRVPSGLIHDWIGTAFIANVTLDDLMHVMRDYTRYKDLYQPAVIASKMLNSKVLDNHEVRESYSILLLNKSILPKTAIDIDFESRYVKNGRSAGSILSCSTRIREIEGYDTHAQRTMPEGVGDGIMWKLFSITYYLERDGGVYLEVEVIALSRDIPASLRWLVEPIAPHASRKALATSLQQTKEAVRGHAALAANKARSRGFVAATGLYGQ